MGVGRRPVPTRLKLLRGNPGHHPLPDAEPEPPTPKRCPAPPAGMDAAAAAVWRLLVPAVHACKLLTDVDLAAFQTLCEHKARYDAANAAIAQGMLLRTPSRWVKQRDANGDVVEVEIPGAPVVNPAWKIVHQVSPLLWRGFAEFGLTPSSRSRVHGTAPEEEQGNPFDATKRSN